MSVEGYHDLIDWKDALEAKQKYGDSIFDPIEAPNDGEDFLKDCEFFRPKANHPLQTNSSTASDCLSKWLPRLRLMLILRMAWITAWNLRSAFAPFLGTRPANDLILSVPITKQGVKQGVRPLARLLE